MAMTKLIFSSDFDAGMDVGMRLVEDPAAMTKKAAAVFGCDASALKPDKDHVGIHLVGLGAFERYGANRNADGFSKRACEKYHRTFVDHGAVFRHHRNQDRSKNLGSIKASAYNHAMDRIELFVHAHKERARDELGRLEKDGEVPFSMACHVPGDRCSVCNQFRRNGDDPAMCDHIRNELGRVYDDGKVACMMNDDPDFFDISFVGRPADRIAWNLKVAGNGLLDSVKLAHEEGLWVPDAIAIREPGALAKLAQLRRIVEFQELYARLDSGQTKTASDRYFLELAKAASFELDDAVIERLRTLAPADAMATLAKAGCVMDPRSFFKYALGPQYTEAEPLMAEVSAAVPGVMSAAVKAGQCQKLCNDSRFSAGDAHRCVVGRVPGSAFVKLAASAFVGPSAEERVIDATARGKTFKIAVDTKTQMSLNTSRTVGLAEVYAAYKLAAVADVLEFHKDTDTDSVLALAAAQNLIA